MNDYAFIQLRFDQDRDGNTVGVLPLLDGLAFRMAYSHMFRRVAPLSFSNVVPHGAWANDDWDDRGTPVPAPNPGEVWDCKVILSVASRRLVAMPIEFVSYQLTPEQEKKRQQDRHFSKAAREATQWLSSVSRD